MSNHYLGSYLLNHNLVHRDVLNQLLQDQRKTHIMLGVLALNNGLMTAQQINEINALQKQVDKKFGELAVDKGYLTYRDVDHLLSQQKSSTVELSQLLLDSHIFTLEELEGIMSDYRQFISDGSITETSDNEDAMKYIFRIIHGQIKEKMLEPASHYIDYGKLMFKSFIRFIDHSVYLGAEDQIALEEPICIALQEMQGSFQCKSYLAMDEATYLKLATQYGKMSITAPGELADASVTEFLNQVNGHYTIQMSDVGLKLSLNPPMTLALSDMAPLSKSLILPFMTTYGKVYTAIQIL